MSYYLLKIMILINCKLLKEGYAFKLFFAMQHIENKYQYLLKLASDVFQVSFHKLNLKSLDLYRRRKTKIAP